MPWKPHNYVHLQVVFSSQKEQKLVQIVHIRVIGEVSLHAAVHILNLYRVYFTT